jgi:BTB/POZ domain-containing protein KCTD9
MAAIERRSLSETWAHLAARGEDMPRDSAGNPYLPSRMPNFDDERFGFAYFRAQSIDADFSACTLRRTYFGRSLLERVRFEDADLAESRMCWNDFTKCDFSGADLSGCDMRASHFESCRFIGASLRGADLRRSSFADCDFRGADLTGAVCESKSDAGSFRTRLSAAQQATVKWVADAGPEPPGG